MVERFDNKAYVNDRLRANGSFPMPRGWTFNLETDLNVQKDLKSFLALFNLPFPIVGKPVRGRGSQGVKVCRSPKELNDHLQSLSAHSPTVMLEKFLSGEEATITVMPPTTDVPRYWAMPIVTRFNHEDDIAPYNGVVAVTSNSRVLAKEELQKDNRYSEASKQCERIAELMQATAPIRVDIRRYNRNPDTPFAIFDINMKPVSLTFHSERLVLRISYLTKENFNEVEYDGAWTSRSRRSGKSDSHVSRCAWLDISDAVTKISCHGASFK